MTTALFGLYKCFSKEPTPKPELPRSSVPGSEENKALEPGEAVSGQNTASSDSRRKERFHTILLGGLDDENGGSDTNLLVTVDARNSRIDVVSLPRDTLLDVPWSVKKLNNAYHHGGFTQTMAEVSRLLGIPVDHYITVDLQAFEELVEAIDGVDFDIHQGEFCAIVGTSGSGKSTLLNMLAGLEKPTKGAIVIGGQHIEQLKEDELVAFRRQHVGFIFQSFHLMATMNAVENTALPLSFRGEDRKLRLKKANQMLDLVGLRKHKKHMPNQMSGGQQQRVGVARALVVDPKIIFADEPTGNLDSHTSEDVMKLMQQVVREQNKTLVMVTHDNHLATYADRIFHISDGKIIKIEEQDRKRKEKEDE